MFFLPISYPLSASKTPSQISLETSDAQGVFLDRKLALFTDVMASEPRLAWLGDMPANYTLEHELLPER